MTILSLLNLKHMSSRLAFGLAATAALATAEAALAATYSQTWELHSTPSQSQLQKWSKIPGKRSYEFRLKDPTSAELRTLTQLPHAESVKIQVDSYPGEHFFNEWKHLASLGAELAVVKKGLPSPVEVNRLNRLGFRKFTIELKHYLYPGEARLLSGLTQGAEIRFELKRFPKPEEQAGVRALAPHLQLHFAVDHWPGTYHRDFLNLLPHSIHLTVREIAPMGGAFKIIQSLKRLRAVHYETSFDPQPPAIWAAFGSAPIEWNRSQDVPREAQLAALETAIAHQAGIKGLVLKLGRDLTVAEASRLDRFKIPVRVHLSDLR